MPSDRATAGSLGRAARADSRRAMALSFCADAADAATSDATTTARENRRKRIHCLLTVWIQHVLEPHPLRVEIQIRVARAAVAILSDQQLSGAFDLAAPVVHVFAEQREHDVRVMLHGAHRSKIVERGAAIVAR